MEEIIIEIVEKSSEEVLQAINSLLPQLNKEARMLTQNDLSSILDLASNKLFVAKENGMGKIIGILSYISNRTLLYKKAILEDLVVDEAHRGKGVGKMLMQSAIDYAKEEQADSIHFTSKPEKVAANKLYQSLGFEKVETNVYRLKINNGS